MGRDKSKVAWGKANSRGDLCSTTSSTTAVQDLLRRDERPHQGPPKSAANVLLRERTEGHSRAYRSSQRTVKTCRRAHPGDEKHHAEGPQAQDGGEHRFWHLRRVVGAQGEEGQGESSC